MSNEQQQKHEVAPGTTGTVHVSSVFGWLPCPTCGKCPTCGGYRMQQPLPYWTPYWVTAGGTSDTPNTTGILTTTAEGYIGDGACHV